MTTAHDPGQTPEPVLPEWISWAAAAELVGCPVGTISYHCRTGRIKSRPRHGSRPTVSRASAEEFAVGWAERESARTVSADAHEALVQAARERLASHPRGLAMRRAGWLSTSDAAAIAGVTPRTVINWVRSGRLPARVTSVGGWTWIHPDALQTLLREREAPATETTLGEWITWSQAAGLAGCTERTIATAVSSGRIEKRDQSPSLSRASVLEYASTRRHRP